MPVISVFPAASVTYQEGAQDGYGQARFVAFDPLTSTVIRLDLFFMVAVAIFVAKALWALGGMLFQAVFPILRGRLA